MFETTTPVSSGSSPGVIVMHPLPRLTELSPELDCDTRAAYFRQVTIFCNRNWRCIFRCLVGLQMCCYWPVLICNCCALISLTTHQYWSDSDQAIIYVVAMLMILMFTVYFKFAGWEWDVRANGPAEPDDGQGWLSWYIQPTLHISTITYQIRLFVKMLHKFSDTDK